MYPDDPMEELLDPWGYQYKQLEELRRRNEEFEQLTKPSEYGQNVQASQIKESIHVNVATFIKNVKILTRGLPELYLYYLDYTSKIKTTIYLYFIFGFIIFMFLLPYSLIDSVKITIVYSILGGIFLILYLYNKIKTFFITTRRVYMKIGITNTIYELPLEWLIGCNFYRTDDEIRYNKTSMVLTFSNGGWMSIPSLPHATYLISLFTCNDKMQLSMILRSILMMQYPNRYHELIKILDSNTLGKMQN